ncbi:LOW QUALITY PROTEIN: uncharacterized protein LOC144123973 [Amblyomma americanum]
MVYFIDYGNVAPVAPENIRPLPDLYLQLPAQAVRCRLHGVHPASAATGWTMEAYTMLATMFQAGPVVANALKLVDDMHEVELASKKGGQSLNQQLVAEGLAASLKAAASPAATSVVASAAEPGMMPHRRPMHAVLDLVKIGDILSMQVTVSAKGIVWCLALMPDMPAPLLQVEKALHDEATKLGGQSRAHEVTVGDYVASKSTKDGHWYRAYVTEMTGSKHTVRYVDYGNDEDNTTIFLLASKHKQVPAAAVRLLTSDPTSFRMGQLLSFTVESIDGGTAQGTVSSEEDRKSIGGLGLVTWHADLIRGGSAKTSSSSPSTPASSGWLHRFKARHAIVGKILSGESTSADTTGSASWVDTEVPKILAHYDPVDVYNADETALFYQMLPCRTLALKGEKCHGGKHSKLRISVLLCANMDGSDKRVPLVIGRSKKPRCFSNSRQLEIQYASNQKAWMTRDIFRGWLQAFDADMKTAGRKVCVILDNCSAHHIEDLELSQVEVKFLPPNCTSLIQPLDQGIINSVKCAYRRRLIDKLLLDLRLERPTKVDLFQALEMLSASWNSTSKEIFENCFRKVGFKTAEAASSEAALPALEEEALDERWQRLRSDGAIPEGVELDDYLFGGSCVLATEEVTVETIVNDVLGNSQDDSEGEADDECDIPTTREVADAIDVLRRFASAEEDQDAIQSLWAYERRLSPTEPAPPKSALAKPTPAEPASTPSAQPAPSLQQSNVDAKVLHVPQRKLPSDRPDMVLVWRTPDGLFVQQQSLTGALNAWVKSQSPEPSTTKYSKAGYVCALFSEDSIWYRGQVLSEQSPDGTYLVLSVDFGNRERMLASSLRPLPPSFAEKPLFAFCVVPQNVPTENSRLAALLQQEPFTAVQADTTRAGLAVVRLERKDGTCINNLISRSPHKDPAQSTVTGSAPQEEPQKPPVAVQTLVNVPDCPLPKRPFDAVVASVEGNLVYIQPIIRASGLLKFTEALANKARRDPGYKFTEMPPVNQCVLAVYSDDDQWYRARVVSADESGCMVRVQFLDYGNTETMSIKLLLPMQEELAKEPASVLAVRLEGTPVLSPWAGEILSREPRVVVQLVGSDSGDGPPLVRLMLKRKCINSMAACMQQAGISGFALRRRTSFCQKLPEAYEDKLAEFRSYVIRLRQQHGYMLGQISNADETPVWFNMPSSTTWVNGDNPKTPTGRLRRPPLATVATWASRAWHSLPNDMVTPKKAYLERPLPSERTKAVITHVDGDWLVYLQQLSLASELQAVMSELNSSVPTTPLPAPSVGDAACARYPADNLWYRVCVLSTPEDGKCKVSFVYFGNEDFVPLPDIRALPDKMKDAQLFANCVALQAVKTVSRDSASELLNVEVEFEVVDSSQPCKAKLFSGDQCLNDLND